MSSSEFVQTKLETQAMAVESSKKVVNNRWHYLLVFDKDVGWDWVERQVEKASSRVDPTVEPYKLRPVKGCDSVIVEVREVERREDIDENQNSLDEFSGR